MMPSPKGGSAAEGAAAPGRERAGCKTVLNVGCGYPLRHRLHPFFYGPDWREIRLDVDPCVQPDIVCSITDMSPIRSDSVDAIWSSHNLEHLYRHEVPLALCEFVRILKHRGLLLLTLPDLQSVAELVVRGQLEDEAYVSPSGPVTPLDMIFGHTASLARGNMFMSHKSGFTAGTLAKVLAEAGFAEIEVRRGNAFDLWASATKPLSA
jgi:predicted SAM-dependent methyltransferase